MFRSIAIISIILCFSSCQEGHNEKSTENKTTTVDQIITQELESEGPEGPYESPVENKTNKDKAISILNALGGPSAILGKAIRENLDRKNHKQHISNIADGSGGFKSLNAQMTENGVTTEIMRVFQMNDVVFMHSIYNSDQPEVGMDIMKFKDGKLIESWGGKEELKGPNVSNHSSIDGPRFSTELDGGQPEINMKVAANYIRFVKIGGDSSKKDKNGECRRLYRT